MGCIGSKDRKFVVSIKLFSYTTLVLFDLIVFFMYFLGVIQVSYFGVLCQQTTVGLSGGLFFIKELESDILGPLIVLPFFRKSSWISEELKVSQVNAAILFPQNTTTWYSFIKLSIQFRHQVFFTMFF